MHAPQMTEASAFVVETREELRTKRDQLLSRLDSIRSDLKQARGPLEHDLDDQAIELENEEVLARLELATRRELEQVLAALDRIDEGVFGICVDCGAQISSARLRVMPHTIRCLACAARLES